MKIAVIATVWFPFSHADVIVTRWIKPFPTDAANGWRGSDFTIASIFLDQTPANDIGREICATHGIPVMETIREALTLGGSKLAVDAVLLIGEHGDYPSNEFGQKLYPRKQFFDAITTVFRETGQTAPVFNDKHLSWDFGLSAEMISTSRELDFPLFAGTSLTHCPYDPGHPLSPGENVSEVLALYSEDPEHYGFHSMEFVQSLIECRPGGETGIASLRFLDNRSVRQALAAREIPHDLLLSTLVRLGFPDDPDTIPFLFSRSNELLGYQIKYRDGLRVCHLRVPKMVSNWAAAVRTPTGKIRSCKVSGTGMTEFFSNFAYLNSRIDEFFRSHQPPSPVLRTHLVAGALQLVLQAQNKSGQWIDTPSLAVTY